ncbi:feminizer isoform X4 [Nomia melanderi]|uniref:feminizer isoform X4 n=1 Tax=Nomia melanderi TaxID=2448451 RepID=UPI001304024B|nr:uncharacterized protein LOC116435229 isoform X4 [Nomia melanderi]
MVEVPLHLSMKMKRNVPRSSHQDEKCKSSRSEDYEASRSRTEEEKMQRRREWMLQQEREREHERLKKKMILEYEMKRAREKGLPAPKHSTPSCSKSRSKSPRSQPRRTSTSTSTSKKAPVLSERLESLDGTVPIFKGPEGTQISANELRRIKVDIHRNIPGESKDTELQRDIINPEDVVVKRREGEGSKPIFERDEIKGTSEEIEERRTVVSVNNENLEGKSKTFKKRSTSLSPVRTRSHSPRRTSSRHSSFTNASQGYGERTTWSKDKIFHVPDCMKTQDTKTEEVVEVIVTERTDDALSCIVLRKNGTGEVVVIIRIQERGTNENGIKILVIEMGDLIESVERDRESVLGKGGIEIGLEKEEFLHNIISNKFLFLFIMVIFLQDQ